MSFLRRVFVPLALFGSIAWGAATPDGAFAADEAGATGEIKTVGKWGPVEKVAGDLQFTEGPTPDAEGALYFTDIPADRIYKLTDDKTLKVFLQPAGHANGLMIDGGGRLFACQMDGKVVQIDTVSKATTTLADKYGEAPLNAPNDLVVDSTGGIYFTDPRFRAATPLPQKVEGVYYRAADGTVTRLHESDVAPNGVILSPDEKTLYVVPSMSKTMLAFDVQAPGKVGPAKTFCQVAQPEGAENESGGDGLTIDAKGNVYVTTNLGIQVFSPKGEALGIISLPEQPANCAFGGKNLDVLYATARTSVYKIPIEAKGWRFPGAGK
jgi:gluconolactonase